MESTKRSDIKIDEGLQNDLGLKEKEEMTPELVKKLKDHCGGGRVVTKKNSDNKDEQVFERSLNG